MTNRAILLTNLGSPDQADTKAVRRYLNQFLMDPNVIQLPWLLRRLIVSLFILPFRPKASANAYQSIWLPEGSPLIVLSEQLKQAVRSTVAMPISMAMRYGKPSIESQLLKLAKQSDISEILLIPLYPHYAQSTVSTSVEQARSVIKKHQLDLKLTIVPPFYDHPDYIAALVSSAQTYLDQPYDHIIFSYHGLPESHITKFDNHCLQSDECCQRNQNSQAHLHCYRHQVLQTTLCFAEQAGLSADRYSIAFQSRLGRAKWLKPNTADRLQELAAEGAKNVLVICPAFVTDCLETLEEIAIRGQMIFKEAGGESVTLIPCLNCHPKWLEVLASWCNS